MSKSLGNVINPDDIIAEYGADAMRLFEMFMGPLEQTKPWSTKGVEGVYRFLGRVWRLVMKEDAEGAWVPNGSITDDPPTPALHKAVHAAIKKVTDDIESLQFNTAISALMVLTNELVPLEKRPRTAVETLVLLLAPFAPHIAEELWFQLGHSTSLSHHPWPTFDPAALVESEIEIILQINGKLRGRMTLPAGLSAADTEARARAHPELPAWLGEKSIRKAIVVPGKLVNFVIG
jgi:leucyl-tRNA synthetase